jgi:hypothetical protein
LLLPTTTATKRASANTKNAETERAIVSVCSVEYRECVSV